MYAKYSMLRDRAGLNDSQVCKKLGIPPSVISYWKTGKTTPKLDKLIKISKLLGVTLDELVSEDEQ